MSFEKSIGQQALGHLMKSRSKEWKENATDTDMVARLTEACVRTTAPDGHGARYVTDGHLIRLQSPTHSL